MITFACGGCGKKFSVKEEFGGRTTKCPDCSTSLTIPMADGAAPDPEPRPPVLKAVSDDPPRRQREFAEDDDVEDYPEARPVRRTQSIGDDAGIRLLLPVGRSGWAIAAGYLGLISVLCFPAPLAVITGLLAIREIRRNPKKHGMGRAIFGIVMGTIGTIFLLIGITAFAMEQMKKM